MLTIQRRQKKLHLYGVVSVSSTLVLNLNQPSTTQITHCSQQTIPVETMFILTIFDFLQKFPQRIPISRHPMHSFIDMKVNEVSEVHFYVDNYTMFHVVCAISHFRKSVTANFVCFFAIFIHFFFVNSIIFNVNKKEFQYRN
jgi:hypothetical protein